MRLRICQNKLIQLCKKPLFLFVFLVVPGILASLLGGFLQETEERGAIPVAIVDLDQTDYSKLIVDRMKKQDRIEMIELSRSEAMRLLERGEVDCVFIIKDSFSEQLLKEKRENVVELWTSPLTMAAAVVQEMMAGEVTRITSNIKAANWVVDYLTMKRSLTANQAHELWKSSYAYSDHQWIPKPLMTIDYKNMGSVVMNKEETSSTFNIYLGFWMAFTMLANFVLTEPLLKERKTIFIRMRTTYLSIRAYLLQTGLAYFLLLVVQAVVSLFLLRHSFSLHQPSLFIELLVFLFFCLSLSIGLASHVRSVGAYYSTGLLLTFVVNIIGGSFFPLGNFSLRFASIGEIFPQHWLMNHTFTSWHIVLVIVLSCVIWIVSIWKLERFYD
ncbi:ABC transporter permease [Schinkia sp. CFF1]